MPKTKFTKEQDAIIKKEYLKGKTAEQLSVVYGCYPQSILNSLKRTQTGRRKEWKRASGIKNGNWRGGTRNVKGYLHVFLPEHRLARKDGWVAIHRMKLDDKIIDKRNVVHHKDNNRKNNDISNLEIYKNNGEHRKEHSKNDKRGNDGRFIK